MIFHDFMTFWKKSSFFRWDSFCEFKFLSYLGNIWKNRVRQNNVITITFSKRHKIMKNHSKNMKKHSKESSNDNLWEKVIYIIFELFFTILCCFEKAIIMTLFCRTRFFKYFPSMTRIRIHKNCPSEKTMTFLKKS